jgi:hypothetical protein
MKATPAISDFIEAAIATHARGLPPCAICGFVACILLSYVPLDGDHERRLRMASGTGLQRPILIYGLCGHHAEHHMASRFELDRIIAHRNRVAFLDGPSAGDVG